MLADSRLAANIHGCAAPLLFALTASLVTFTSRRWTGERGGPGVPPASRLFRWALAALVAVWGQIAMGAQLRHVEPWPALFPLWVWLHLLMLAVLATIAVRLVFLGRAARSVPLLARRAGLLAGLFALQLLLGAATWVTTYGWPKWFQEYVWAVGYTVVSEGRLQVLAATAHAMVGALLLAAALSLALGAARLQYRPR